VYDTQNAGGASDCFDKCEADAKCAAASFQSPECSLLKFGFEKESDVSDCTAYIKLEVVVDMTGMEKLTNKFPIVKLKTRLLGFYSNIDTLTPSQCFDTCKASSDCGGATFTTDAKKPKNCFISHPGSFTESTSKFLSELWTSYTKVVNEVALDNSSVEIQVTNERVLFMQENTRMLGNIYANLRSASVNECFDKCDADAKCAAATATKTECFLLKYGFEVKTQEEGWSAYAKPEVVIEQSNFDKLAQETPFLLKTRLVNHYYSLDALTPMQCFTKCSETERCGAASFSADRRSPQNCLFFNYGVYKYSNVDHELWISFTKQTLSGVFKPVSSNNTLSGGKGAGGKFNNGGVLGVALSFWEIASKFKGDKKP
jgi:hypothetical protein